MPTFPKRATQTRAPFSIERLESRRLMSGLAGVPDGMIVFMTNRDGNYELYSMNPDGTNLTNLTNNPALDAIPQVSHDGTKVAFASDRGHPGNMEIFLMNSDGTGLQSITHGALPGSSYWDPAPSPDNSKVLYMGPNAGANGYDIWVANVDGSGAVDVTPGTGGSFASWSLDGTKIIYGAYAPGTTDEEIYWMNADGSNKTRVTYNVGRDTYPSFTENQHILFTTERDGNREIYSCNLDGSNPVNLTNNPSTDQVPYVYEEWVSFISYRNGDAEIYIMNLDGTGQTRITNNPAQDVYPGWGETPETPPPPVLPALSIGDTQVTEGDSGTLNATFTVTLSAASASTVNVNFATADGSATLAGNDYTATYGALSFAPGVLTRMMSVPVKGDLLVEANENFLVNLSSPANATIADGQGVGTILNSDAYGQIQLSSATYSVNESSASVTITATRTGGKAGAVGVSYATSNGTAGAGDFTAKSGALSWLSGDTASKTFTVPILNDAVYEGNETFTVALSAASGGEAPGSVKTGTVTIVDDELPPPPPGGKVYFMAGRDGHPEIYSMNPDGSAQTRLTSGASYNVMPYVSPDGSKLVFASARDNNDLEIYSMNPDGSGQTRLTNSPGTDYTPAITPDKSKVAFISSCAGNYDVWIMNANGTNPTNLTANNSTTDHYLSINPAGTKILFASDRTTPGKYQLFSMNLDGTAQTRLLTSTANDIYPVMSPDGSKIAFTSDRNGNREIYLMNSNGTGLVNLTNNAGGDQSPYFSPDGTKLAFTSDRSGNQEIYTMNFNGSGVTKLTTNTTQDTYSVWGGSPAAALTQAKMTSPARVMPTIFSSTSISDTTKKEKVGVNLWAPLAT